MALAVRLAATVGQQRLGTLRVEKPHLPDGTYELCGPKVQGNPEGLSAHVLVRHGVEIIQDAPREYLALKYYFARVNIEGIVWHHQDGRMVKIKGKDFGIKRALIIVGG